MTTLRFMLGVMEAENLDLIQLDVKNSIPPQWPKVGNLYGAAERLCGLQPETSSLSTKEESTRPTLSFHQTSSRWVSHLPRHFRGRYEELAKFVQQLSLKFAMKDLSPAWHILRMKISQNQNQRELFLSPTDYIGCVLETFNMQSAKSASTPLSWRFSATVWKSHKNDN